MHLNPTPQRPLLCPNAAAGMALAVLGMTFYGYFNSRTPALSTNSSAQDGYAKLPEEDTAAGNMCEKGMGLA